jgi:hypothetical protein
VELRRHGTLVDGYVEQLLDSRQRRFAPLLPRRISCNSPATLAVALSLLALLPGCGRQAPAPSPASPGKHFYSFAILNRTGAAIHHCVMQWGDKEIDFGTEMPNGLATQGFYPYPIPQQARIEWFDADGARHEAQAVVRCPQGRPGVGGDIICVLLPDNTLRIHALSQNEGTDILDPNNRFRIGIDPPHYIVATYNATEHPLTDLKVFFGKHHVNADPRTGPRSTDSNAGWRFTHGMPYTITEQARVAWKQGGKEQERFLEMKAKLPKDLDGVCIVIVIDDPPRIAAVPWSKRPRWWMDTRP